LDMLFWAVVFYFFSDNVFDLLKGYISLLPFGENINGILFSLGSGIIGAIVYYELVILSMGVFSAFFIDKITEIINAKHYRLEVKGASLLKGVWISIKALFIFLLILLVTFYMFFIPVLNIFYQVFLFSVAVKKPLVFDSSALFCDFEELEKKYNLKIWTLVFVSSFVYFIPVISFFGYLIQLIMMTHFLLSGCKKA